MAGKLTTKIEKVIVQVCIHRYNEAGELMEDTISNPMPCYRAKTQDFWGFLEREVAKMDAAQEKTDA